MTVLKYLRMFSVWFVISIFLYSSIDGVYLLATLISEETEQVAIRAIRTIIIGLAIYSFILVIFLKYWMIGNSLSPSLVFFIFYNLGVMFIISYLGNDRLTLTAMILFLVLNVGLIFVEKILFKNEQQILKKDG